jgi:hypothetical protein
VTDETSHYEEGDTSVASMNARPQRERFRLRWWTVASIAPMVLAVILLDLRGGLSQCFGVIVLSALSATVVYFISGRRALVANVMFAVLMLLLMGTICVLSWETSKLHADRIMMDKEARFGLLMKQATDAQNAFLNAGAISAAKLDQPGELDRRLALLNELRSRMAEAVKAADGAGEDIDRQLAAAHVVRWHRGPAVAQFNRDTQWSYYAGTMHVTLPFYDRCGELLNYLRDHRDEWSVKPGVNNIEFKTPAAKARVDALRETIQSAAAAVQGAPLPTRRKPASTRTATRE